MNIVERARHGYGRSATPIRSARTSEYEAIARISHRLRATAKSRSSDFPSFVAAVHDNRKLWTILAADVAQSGNGLPEELRARLFWLSEFTDAESRRILRGTGDVGILIEINAAVLQVLGSERETA